MSLAQVNGTEIWYSIEGTGHPLMLCPGLGMDHQYYRLAVPLLVARFSQVEGITALKNAQTAVE